MDPKSGGLSGIYRNDNGIQPPQGFFTCKPTQIQFIAALTGIAKELKGFVRIEVGHGC